MSHSWGYGESNGPSTWGHSYPIANGKRQSPVDIVPTKAPYDPKLKPLVLKYDPSTCIEILNNGHSFQVTYADDTNTSTLTGGPVSGIYRLKQFHCHWGACDEEGSEHTVNGTRFPCELHLVHWNTKYASFAEAANKDDGLAVVGVFLEIGDENAHIQTLIDAFQAISNAKTQTAFENFNPAMLLPASLHYWTYPGSLTTPPLYESVTWIVLPETISISAAQMAQFRTLLFSAKGEPDCCMVNNYRPPQPLHGRTIHASFK